MNKEELDQKAAYVLGAYHALYEYFQHNPFMDKYYNEYKQGYDEVINGLNNDNLKVFL
jgi:hypothetical protein